MHIKDESYGRSNPALRIWVCQWHTLFPGAAIKNTKAVPLHWHLLELNLMWPWGSSQFVTICFHYTQKLLQEEDFNMQQNILASVHINYFLT